MAMDDVRSMAHVEKFSHLTIPMLWFEISLNELPLRLENRFSLYLNILPLVEKVGLYCSLALGAVLSIVAVTQVAIRTSKSLATQKYHQKFSRNLVYGPCEEKLVDRHMPKVEHVDETSSDDGGMSNVITRSQYELEEDDALSDIDYDDIDDESASSSTMSPVSSVSSLAGKSVWLRSQKSKPRTGFLNLITQKVVLEG